MRRAIQTIGTAAIACLLGAALVPSAQAVMGPGQSTASATERGQDPAVSVSESGWAAVAWSRRISPYASHAYVRRRDPQGVWGPLEKVSTAIPDPYGSHGDTDGGYTPSVAVDARGNTLVTWASGVWLDAYDSRSAIYGAYAPVGQPFRPQQLVAFDPVGYSGGQRPDTVFTPQGEAVTVWLGMDDRVHSTVMEPGGRFLPDQVIAEDVPGHVAYQPLVRAGRDGTVIAAWRDHTEDPWLDRALVAVRRPGQPFGRAQMIRGAYDSTFGMVVGIASDGSALLAVSEVPERTRVMRRDIATLAAGATTFAAPKQMPATWSMPVAIAFDDAQHGYLFRLDEGISAQPATTSGQFGEAVPIAPAGTFGSGGSFDAAYDAGGGLIAGWRGVERADEQDDSPASYYAYVVTKAAGSSTFDPLVEAQHSDELVTPLRVAAGRPGDALATWVNGWYGTGLVFTSESTGGAGGPLPTATPGPTPGPMATPTPAPGSTAPPTPTPGPGSAAPPTATPTPSVPAQTAAPNSSTTPPTSSPVPPAAGGGGSAQSDRSSSGPAPRAWCRIPDVRGRRVADAKRKLVAAGCATGRVRYTRGKRAGRVVRQSTPGAVREHRFRVVLVVSR